MWQSGNKSDVYSPQSFLFVDKPALQSDILLLAQLECHLLLQKEDWHNAAVEQFAVCQKFQDFK